ncbi:MAG: HD domain-containing protein [Christensenellales bacterium]
MAHSGARRKGKNIPYILHPLEAAAIVSSVTDNLEEVAAAVLHDVLEDTNTTEDK